MLDAEVGGGQAVVLVHGLWMNGLELAWLRRRLARHGYRTYRFRYPSLRVGLVDNAARLQGFLHRSVREERVHLVAHSLGGLLVRQLFCDYPQQRPGRVVTLGTPHCPSWVARRAESLGLGRYLLGRSLPALLGEVPPWRAERALGSIGGTLSLGMGRLFGAVPTPNDGTVVLSETQLAGMRDHLVLPYSHFSMLYAAQTAEQVAHFLRHGAFRHP